MFCRILCCFIAKFLFYAIYAVLSRNLFCRDLRALAWRKIGPTILSVEKKGQISGMGQPLFGSPILNSQRLLIHNISGIKDLFLLTTDDPAWPF